MKRDSHRGVYFNSSIYIHVPWQTLRNDLKNKNESQGREKPTENQHGDFDGIHPIKKLPIVFLYHPDS